MNFLYFSLLAKVLITIKIKILTLFKKSPKMEPNFWALFLKKNCAKGFKKSPKWRKIAQSGHTECELEYLIIFVQACQAAADSAVVCKALLLINLHCRQKGNNCLVFSI